MRACSCMCNRKYNLCSCCNIHSSSHLNSIHSCSNLSSNRSSGIVVVSSFRRTCNCSIAVTSRTSMTRSPWQSSRHSMSLRYAIQACNQNVDTGAVSRFRCTGNFPYIVQHSFPTAGKRRWNTSSNKSRLLSRSSSSLNFGIVAVLNFRSIDSCSGIELCIRCSRNSHSSIHMNNIPGQSKK